MLRSGVLLSTSRQRIPTLMPTVVIIALCIIGPVLWALYVRRGARRRLALTPEHPDKPYDTFGPYVIGGRWGYNLLTGELGYESYKFTDNQTATYMCLWLNNANDHRSLAMAFFDWGVRAEADRAKREAQRKADLAKERAMQDLVGYYDPCYCNSCNCYISRADRRNMSFLRTGRCYDCEMAHHERRLVATFQVPGARYVPGLEATILRAAATRFTASSGPR